MLCEDSIHAEFNSEWRCVDPSVVRVRAHVGECSERPGPAKSSTSFPNKTTAEPWPGSWLNHFAAEGNNLAAVTVLELIVQIILSLNKIDSFKFEAALAELAITRVDAGQEFGPAALRDIYCMLRRAPPRDYRRLNALRRVHEYILQFTAPTLRISRTRSFQSIELRAKQLTHMADERGCDQEEKEEVKEHRKITVYSLAGEVVITTQLPPSAVVRELRDQVASALNWPCYRLNFIAENGCKMKQYDVIGQQLTTSARIIVVKRSPKPKPKWKRLDMNALLD